jgi:hypothetical protein
MNGSVFAPRAARRAKGQKRLLDAFSEPGRCGARERDHFLMSSCS